MSETVRRTAGTQKGPRSARVIDSVHAAMLSELERVGFAHLTMDGVAQVAKVSRSTLYRRWPSKAALLTDVMEPLLQRYETIRATGNLQEDLFALMVTMRDNVSRPEGRALFTAIAQGSADLHEVIDQMSRRTLAGFVSLMKASQARGEFPADEDVEVVAHLLFYGVGMWEYSHLQPPTDTDLLRIRAVVMP